MNGVTMILPGDQPREQTAFEAWVDRLLGHVPPPVPPASLPAPATPPGGSRKQPDPPGGETAYRAGSFCLGADVAVCSRLGPGWGRDACGAASNIACLMAGFVLLIVLAALAFVPQGRPGMGLAIVAVLVLGWAWQTGRLTTAVAAARGA